VFGGAEGGKMPMQAYARFLSANKAPAIAVITSMYFDEEAETPKLFFKAARPLTEPELNVVVEVKGTDEVKQALDMTVAETDKVSQVSKSEAVEEPKTKPEPEIKQEAKTKPEPADVPEEDEIEEPVKAVKKKAKSVEVDEDLASIIDDWDDA